jgi:hypothetical protein
MTVDLCCFRLVVYLYMHNTGLTWKSRWHEDRTAAHGFRYARVAL